MNPLQQIADNLAALNSDAPERADAVIKQTNMAATVDEAIDPDDRLRAAYVNAHDAEEAWLESTGHLYDPSLPIDAGIRAVLREVQAHPSRGVVDELGADEVRDLWMATDADGITTTEHLRRFAKRIQAAALPAVPEGWVLVPREPTEAMLEAAMQREDDEPLSDWGKLVPAPHAEIYAAMLAATPAHDQPALPRKSCPVGCDAECLSQAHGCRSECPILPALPLPKDQPND